MSKMSTGPRYSVRFRRRRNSKTNYHKRLALLKSHKARIVIRRSNQYINAQIIDYKLEGDVTIASASSKELKKYGWKHSTKNIPAAYLTGLLLGQRAKKTKIKEAVLDLGRYTKMDGSRIYSAVKGIVDANTIQFPYDEKIFPNEKRLAGEHIQKEKSLSSDFEKIKKKIRG